MGSIPTLPIIPAVAAGAGVITALAGVSSVALQGYFAMAKRQKQNPIKRKKLLSRRQKKSTYDVIAIQESLGINPDATLQEIVPTTTPVAHTVQTPSPRKSELKHDGWISRKIKAMRIKTV